MTMSGIGIRVTEGGNIAFDLPDAKVTIEMQIEEAVRFACRIGEVAQIAAAQKGMALIIDQGGEPKLVHESVLKAIEEGLDVVLGGEVVRPIDRTVGTPDDAVLVGKEQKT
jgi:hypothetical protein